ncbi:MAG: hypothetical protein WBC90_15125 [Albidovulum sp.]
MPYIVGLLGLVAAAFFWASRARDAARVTHELSNMAGDVLGAARRFGFRRRANTHPVENIDDPKLAIGGVGLAFLELGGLPSREDQDALIAAFENRLGLTPAIAEEIMVLGRWLVNESGGPQSAINRIARRLVKIGGIETLDPLMKVLNDTATSGRGGLSTRQKEALEEIARLFRLS